MALGRAAVLGIALGTSTAGGFVTGEGGITSSLDELAFAPIDYHPAAPRDEWSGDYGCGVAVPVPAGGGPPAGAGGDRDRSGAAPAEKAEARAGPDEAGDERARRIYETLGVYLGYALALRHLLRLPPRAAAGPGDLRPRRRGDRRQAREVLRSRPPGSRPGSRFTCRTRPRGATARPRRREPAGDGGRRVGGRGVVRGGRANVSPRCNPSRRPRLGETCVSSRRRATRARAGEGQAPRCRGGRWGFGASESGQMLRLRLRNHLGSTWLGAFPPVDEPAASPPFSRPARFAASRAG